MPEWLLLPPAICEPGSACCGAPGWAAACCMLDVRGCLPSSCTAAVCWADAGVSVVLTCKWHSHVTLMRVIPEINL